MGYQSFEDMKVRKRACRLAVRVYEDLKKKGVEMGEVGPPTLMPSGRTHFTLNGPYGVGIQFGEEMLMEDYVEDYVKSLTKKKEGKDK